MKDYLKHYAAPTTPKFQMGGAMPAEPAPQANTPNASSPAPSPEQGGAADVEAMLQQYAQSHDPQLAVQICDALLAMMSQGAGAAPAPSMRNGGRMVNNTPVFKKGGKLL